MSYVLCTARLDIGPAPEDDSDIRNIVGWLNDPATMRYSEQRHRRHTIASQRHYIDSLGEDDNYLTIYHQRRLIGTMTVFIDIHNNIADVGILIGDKASWGNGFGFEAWKAVCDKTFKDWGVRKMEAGCVEDNLPMMGICARYGMSLEGRRYGHFLYQGLPADLVYWGKFKP